MGELLKPTKTDGIAVSRDDLVLIFLCLDTLGRP